LRCEVVGTPAHPAPKAPWRRGRLDVDEVPRSRRRAAERLWSPPSEGLKPGEGLVVEL